MRISLTFISLLVASCIVTQTRCQELLNVEFSEEYDPGNKSVPGAAKPIQIPVQVVPSGSLFLPNTELRVESGETPVETQPDTDPMINQEVIESGPAPSQGSGPSDAEEVMIEEEDLVREEDVDRAVDPEDMFRDGTMTPDVPPGTPEPGVTDPEPPTTITTTEAPPTSEMPSSSTVAPGVSESSTESPPDGPTPAPPTDGPNPTAKPTTAKPTVKESTTGLWVGLGIVVLVDFALIVVLMIILAKKKKELEEQSRPRFPSVALAKPAGGWTQADPLPHEAGGSDAASGTSGHPTV